MLYLESKHGRSIDLVLQLHTQGRLCSPLFFSWYRPSKMISRDIAPKKRDQGYHYWCQIGTRTYVGITFVAAVRPQSVIGNLLDGAHNWIINWLSNHADGVIQSQFRQLGAQATTLTADSANNHGLTYGVLGAALDAIKDFMMNNNAWGTATFDIFDGENQTGRGSITGAY